MSNWQILCQPFSPQKDSICGKYALDHGTGTMDESVSITRLKNGDIGGLASLVRKYQIRAMRAAYLIVRDTAVAEDIVQAAFIRAYERIQQFDASRPFGPWFLKSVVNDALKTLARSSRHVSLESGDSVDEIAWPIHLVKATPSLLDVAEDSEVKGAVWKALGLLSPPQRAAVVLRYYLDFSEIDIAQKLRRPPGTVKWLLSTARVQLRQALRVWRPSAHSELSPVPNKD